MSTRGKLGRLKSDVRSWISQNGEVGSPSPRPALSKTRVHAPAPGYNVDSSREVSPGPEGTSTETPHPDSRRGQGPRSEAPVPPVTPGLSASTDSAGWPYLRLLGKTLEQSARSFGPLKDAIGGLIESIKVFEAMSDERKEYGALRDDLEGLFQELQDSCTQSIPPTIVACHRSIQREISYLQKKQRRGNLRRYVETGNDPDEVISYSVLRQVNDALIINSDVLINLVMKLNMNMSVWRIVDEIAADNRLRHLSPSLSARYDSSKAVELKRGPCTQGTRVDLLKRILSWTDSPSPGSVYWVSGMAGTGKTTIAYSLCAELDAKGRLPASFFCSRLLPECRDFNLLIPSIAYQFARFSYPFRSVLSGILEKNPDVHTRLPRLQFDALISQPLIEVKNTLPENLVVVIDALDECDNKGSVGQILDVLLTDTSNLPVKFVVSSRPEPAIRDKMTKQSDQDKSRLVLHELDKHTVQADIEAYLRAELVHMQPTENQIMALVRRAGILFIYAATAVRYIGYDNFQRNPRARLENVLSTSTTTENKHKEIDELYTTILREALGDPNLDKAERDDMREVLHSVICAKEPFTVDSLSGLLKMNDPDRVRAALRPLWSVLHVSGSSELVTTLHASFPDYMLDTSRSAEYHCDSQVHNQTMVRCCFDLFRDMCPQFNICGLESSFVPDNRVVGLEERVKSVVTTELFYAARYWGSHLCAAAASTGLIQQLQEFLSARLLLWMEVMNLKGCKGDMPEVIRAADKWNAVGWMYFSGTMTLILNPGSADRSESART
ncbi:hypothetical protein FRC11_000432 [Ceratobasidium sp. 423]|nr:hypothetical protein FRC11_000432 [Ceratobasidium sp. 423]